jgi:hypothetical protein
LTEIALQAVFSSAVQSGRVTSQCFEVAVELGLFSDKSFPARKFIEGLGAILLIVSMRCMAFQVMWVVAPAWQA